MAVRRPAEVFPPWEYVQEELEARGWTIEDLARETLNPPSFWRVCFRRKAMPMTEDLAARLGAAFGTGMHLWLSLDKTYRTGEVSDGR